jgi:hypothetical protein
MLNIIAMACGIVLGIGVAAAIIVAIIALGLSINDKAAQGLL